MISIFTGVAGLRAHQRSVDVIANNIANINTVGFKAGRASFQEALVQTLRSGSEAGTNPVQIGLGVDIGSVDNMLAQGNLKSTGRLTDFAVMGDGFFVLGDGSSTRFTRDGIFQLDSRNRLVSASNGMRVAGWQADPVTGDVNTAATIDANSEIIIPLGTMFVSRQTANVIYRSNLDAGAPIDTVVPTSFSIYDSLGVSHQVNVEFTKTANNEWDWSVTSPDGTCADTGTVQFDDHGQIQTPSIDISLDLTDDGGAANPIDMTLDMSAVMQLAGESNIQVVFQDGMPAGILETFTVDKEGIIMGVFSNGMSQRLGQLALARVPNPSGLSRLGGNLYGVSPNSGIPLITPAGTGGSGTVQAGSLEMSNVDLANEFANLVITQRGFQANSRVITTGDEMLQDLLTLKR